MKKVFAFIKSIYPSFKQVKKFFAKETTSNVPFWFIYPIVIFLITLFYICLGITYLFFMAGSRKYSKPKYPSDKYRKVVKEGLFYDSVEYHER